MWKEFVLISYDHPDIHEHLDFSDTQYESQYVSYLLNLLNLMLLKEKYSNSECEHDNQISGGNAKIYN